MGPNPQPPPSVCPNCSKPNPERLTNFQSATTQTAFYVYKCDCGYMFLVENVAIPTSRAKLTDAEREPAEPDDRRVRAAAVAGRYRVAMVESVVLACSVNTRLGTWTLCPSVVDFSVWKITLVPMEFSIRDLLLVTVILAL